MTKNSQSTHLLRLPLSVKAEVERFAKADGVSINQFVATAVAKKLAAMHTAAFCRAMAIDAGHSRILWSEVVTAHTREMDPQSLSSNEPTSIDAETRGPHCRPMDAVFPDADVDTEVAEPDTLEPVSPTDRPRRRHRHCNTRAAIITFKVTDFAAAHLNLPIEVIHADDFVMDMVDLNEKRAVTAFRELRTRQEKSSVGGG